MELASLHELYVEGLRDLYSAEQQILKALPKLRAGATNSKVKDAFATHLAQTEEHVTRLEQIFVELDMSPKGKHCKGMEGLVAEGSDLLKEDAAPDVLDAGLISSVQHIEHYEMAGYGTARTYAQLLGFPKQAELLQKTLDEEQATDLLLTKLALTVNVAAIAADSEMVE